MSIRSEPKEMSPGMAQALTIPQHVMTAAQAEGPLMAPAGAETAMVSAPVNEQHLAPANDFNTSNPNHPLKRTVVINIRSSLADLCLKKSRATWSPPSAEATKAILQQRKCKFSCTRTHCIYTLVPCALTLVVLVQSSISRARRRRRAT